MSILKIVKRENEIKAINTRSLAFSQLIKWLIYKFKKEKKD
jgi:hypothetical protein